MRLFLNRLHGSAALLDWIGGGWAQNVVLQGLLTERT
jgi:hypothetical protein